MITEHVIIPEEITEFVIVGYSEVEEILTIIKTQYGGISKGVLWNLSAGSNANLTRNDMRRIARAARIHAVHKRTAYLGFEDLEFGLFRMYESYAQIENVSAEMRVFRDRDKAIAWLKE